MGHNSFGYDGSCLALWSALIVEIIATALFLYAILAATDKRNPSAAAAPAAIGLALTGIHLVLIPLTGTSVNPARSIGPALFAGSDAIIRSEEHTSELQSLMRISYAVFCLNKKPT